MNEISLTEMTYKLVQHKIAFSIYFPASEHFVVTVTENVNNEQLRVLVELGGVLEKNGTVRILGKLDD
jgi:spore coat polysaccharide biosynthesis predicted glycosyltransferase SpsG